MGSPWLLAGCLLVVGLQPSHLAVALDEFVIARDGSSQIGWQCAVSESTSMEARKPESTGSSLRIHGTVSLSSLSPQMAI